MKTEAILQVEDKAFELFIPFSRISECISAMGTQLNQDYESLRPVFIPVLNGSFMFASDLIREICIPCQVSFIKTASYEGMRSTGSVNQLIGLEQDVKGRHLILLEDIVDTGKTLAVLLPELMKLEPASIQIASLFFKPGAFQESYDVKYKGFEIPDKFIIGYGLDYKGYGRNYRDVYCLSEN
jgi:hypoxanthine phosphoribosyltransferase